MRSLSDPELGAAYGGTIPARFDAKTLVPDVAVYRVRVSLDPQDQEEQNVLVPLRGQIHISGERRSIAGRIFRAAAAVVLRKWGN